MKCEGEAVRLPTMSAGADAPALYKLSTPLAATGEHPAASFVRLSYSSTLDETAAFVATEDGKILSYRELPATMRGKHSHSAILARLGYRLKGEPEPAPTADPFKMCGCGRAWATHEAWSALPDSKIFTADNGALCDQRRCPCGSHIVAPLIPAATLDEMRRAVRVLDSMPESFNDDYTAPELLRLMQVCWASGWDITPEDWTAQQIAHALESGLPPTFEERSAGLHAVGVDDCACHDCRNALALHRAALARVPLGEVFITHEDGTFTCPKCLTAEQRASLADQGVETWRIGSSGWLEKPTCEGCGATIDVVVDA